MKMKTTINIEINRVYSGYFRKGDLRYREKFGYWVEVRCDGVLIDTVWSESYNELVASIVHKYTIAIPFGDKRKSLKWMNYGAPYNVAII